MGHPARRLGSNALRWLLLGLLAAVVSLPVSAERAIENAEFDDRLGTLPVQISLCRNGVSTLDTGVLGRIYWAQTGAGGFGAYIRATGPPEAGGTLTSYVDPEFVQANAQFISDTDAVAAAYGAQLAADFWRRLGWTQLAVLVIGGALLLGLFRVEHPFPGPGASTLRRVGIPALTAVLALGLSLGLAAHLFDRWECSNPPAASYPMPDVPGLSFSSQQTREVGQQVRPFIEKNTQRIKERAERYVDRAEVSLPAALADAAASLEPREGERVVLAEADPQGSLVGTRVRRVLYASLVALLGEDAIALRTISGDVSSNGAVAEREFVRREAEASGEIATVAVKGDHDSAATIRQLEDYGVAVPDLSVVDVGGFEVAGAADPEFKTLFGGLISNESGVSETEAGAQLREEVGDGPVIVLMHQPELALGYLDLEDLSLVRASVGHETTPWDDGIPDLPAGTVNVGHLHDAEGPWVVWNTDGELVTWTVVDQLGTSGGVEERPTFNRFSTPFSAPLKTLGVRLQYFNVESGLQTGFASIELATNADAVVTERVDVGLPGGLALPADELDLG